MSREKMCPSLAAITHVAFIIVLSLFSSSNLDIVFSRRCVAAASCIDGVPPSLSLLLLSLLLSLRSNNRRLREFVS